MKNKLALETMIAKCLWKKFYGNQVSISRC